MSQISPQDERTITLTVGELDGSQRIDAYLASQLEDLTRNALKQHIESGRVLLDGQPVKAARQVRGGEVITVSLPPARSVEVEPEEIPLEVIYEDQHMIAVNKPAGMVVHPAPGHSRGTLVNALLNHCDDLSGINGELRPGIVHRLDIGTTGVIVAAKNDEAHIGLSRQFQERSLEKTYQALVYGPVGEPEGRIDTLIDRDPANRLRMAVLDGRGREAVTTWKAVKNWPGFSLLHVGILTGRTHQIRVHCAHIGHPVAGDDLYAGKRWRGVENTQLRSRVKNFERPALHAWRLRLQHPVSGEALELVAPLPGDMQSLIKAVEELS